jgi:hypothetical protein
VLVRVLPLYFSLEEYSDISSSKEVYELKTSGSHLYIFGPFGQGELQRFHFIVLHMKAQNIHFRNIFIKNKYISNDLGGPP